MTGQTAYDPQHFRLKIEAADAGVRLDQAVSARVPELSRTLTRKLVEIGGVHLNGRRLRRCSQPLQAGDHVEIYIDGLPLTPFQLQPSQILFRDDYLLAVNKPAGIDCQPTPARYQGTLYAALLVFLQDPRRPRQQPSLGMVQRLDRDTSGVLLFSIHPRAHKGLSQAFAGREVRKRYLAVVAGTPANGEGEIRSLLARSRRDNRVRSVERGGREAITRYRVRERFATASRLEVEILTGRSHQIRAHLSELGHPLLGDSRYGGPQELAGLSLPRQLLHASSLQLNHPVSGAPLELQAPLPDDISLVLDRLRDTHSP